jgi:hypothetical protein
MNIETLTANFSLSREVGEGRGEGLSFGPLTFALPQKCGGEGKFFGTLLVNSIFG